MSLRSIICVVAAALSLCVAVAAEPVPATLREACTLMLRHNATLRIAEGEVAMAHSDKALLSAAWYPTVSVEGGGVWMSNPVEYRASLRTVTDPLVQRVGEVLPNDVIIRPLLNRLGAHSLAFPLVPQGVASIDASVVWPVFTGGRRIFAGRLGGELQRAAESTRDAAKAELQLRLVESYYAVVLAEGLCDVRRRGVEALERHLWSVSRMLEQGLVNVTERLVVEVALEDARASLLAAEGSVVAAQSALNEIVGVDSATIRPTTPMFVADSLPSARFFRLRAESNPVVQTLGHGIETSALRLRMSRSGYAPTVVLWGRQNLYSYGLDSHLLPRSMVGVGVSWTLFDGLAREHTIRRSRLALTNARLAHSQAIVHTCSAIDRLLADLAAAAARVRSSRRALGLSQRVLDNRRREWAEGVASVDEVVDAEVAVSAAREGLLTAFYAYDVALAGLLSLCGVAEMFYDLAAQATDTSKNL